MEEKAREQRRTDKSESFLRSQVFQGRPFISFQKEDRSVCRFCSALFSAETYIFIYIYILHMHSQVWIQFCFYALVADVSLNPLRSPTDRFCFATFLFVSLQETTTWPNMRRADIYTNIYLFELDYQRFTPHLLSGWIRSISADKGGMFLF